MGRMEERNQGRLRLGFGVQVAEQRFWHHKAINSGIRDKTCGHRDGFRLQNRVNVDLRVRVKT
jgi:hypothetical protein